MVKVPSYQCRAPLVRLTARDTQGERPLSAQPLPPTLIPPPLTHAGLALACGLLQPGDLLLSVNEVEVTDHEAAAMLIRAAPDQLVLRFRRPPVSG